MAGTGHLLPWPTSQSVRRRGLMRNQMRWKAFPEPNGGLPLQAGLPRRGRRCLPYVCYVCVLCYLLRTDNSRPVARRSRMTGGTFFFLSLFWFAFHPAADKGLEALAPEPGLLLRACAGRNA